MLCRQLLLVMMSFQSVRSLLSPVRKSAFRLPSRHRSTTCSEIALSTLRKRFGLEEFLPGQQEIVEAVARGKNSLVVLPTSGGKSLCYQLPALLRGGITLVVSPLIALMKDQVDALQAKGVRAAFINSQLSLVETKNCLDSLSKGEFELIYVAPERFLNPEFLTALEKVDIRLLAIDEAHCVSQWGHDFRPAYQRIGYVRTLLKYPATVALTATATSIVQQDILESLQMKNARVFRASIDRPNLLITVIQCKDTGESGYKAKIFSDREKLARLPKLVGKGPTIVYCATRKNVELVAKRLAERGQSVVSYHGGMSPEERNQVQEDFMGRGAEIVVATNAFGMGIDRPDIRTIVHYDLPGSVEAYYQEIGRAGRDGLPSNVVLLYSRHDNDIQEFFIKGSYPSLATVHLVYKEMRALWLEHNMPEDLFFAQSEFMDRLPGSSWSIGGSGGVASCLKLLEKNKVLNRIHASSREAVVLLKDIDDVEQHKPIRGYQKIVYGALLAHDEIPITIHPNDFGEAIGLSRLQLLLALKGLHEKGYIDYEAPGRSGGVSMLKGDDAELNLDPAEQRKIQGRLEAGMHKLQTVTSFVECNCRRRFLAEYFGQNPSFVECGTCDLCQARDKACEVSR